MILIFGGTTEGRIAIQTLEEAGKLSTILPKGMSRTYFYIMASACKALWMQ